MPTDKHFVWVILASLAILLLGVGIALTTQRSGSAYIGSVIDPPAPAPELDLVDQHGQAFSLSSFKGRIVLIYFGYTRCPDFCPTTMAVLRQMRSDLGDQADAVQVVLVTTDPERDTPEQLATYLSAFDLTFLGLTGSEESLQMAYKDYGVTVMDDGTTHSTRVYVIDGQGRMRLTLPYGMTAGDIVKDIRLVMKEQ
jgi:protein SCO1/2